MSRRLPRHYKPHKVEREVRKFWDEKEIKQKVVENISDKKPFYFLDGPPYATGRIHLGTALNKILKDVAIRYYTSKGHNVRRQPGWDMHGLPIEVKTERKLGLDVKKDLKEEDVEKFIEECKKLALSNKEIMEEQMKELGVWMDWGDPYMTIRNEWIEAEWWVLKKAWRQGLLYKDQKVLHWCPRCQTALAEHEVEYTEMRDPSIYVRFPLKKAKENEYVVIWTTTPWTLPANMAVLLHPDRNYVQVKIPSGERWWLAEERMEVVMDEIGIEEYNIIKREKGRELEGLKYIHPFLQEYKRQEEFNGGEHVHTLLTGPEVDLTEGTGCVHIAPGHGKEDLELGKRYGLPVYSPVGEGGEYTEGEWEGINVKEADSLILEKLKEKGFLISSDTIKHRYPICWRCKSALLFLSTTQWFLNLAEIKEELFEKNYEEVQWIPSWTRDRFLDGVKKVGDWCVSRQRYWNAPLPLWQCKKCGHEEMIGSVSELEEKAKTPLGESIDLHRPFVDEILLQCPECGEEMERIRDVLDVWFDSGVASWASLKYPRNKDLFDKFWPSDLVIEGEDQVLKWFYVQQILGIIAFGEVPYQRVVMHGFVQDAEGKAMHKSLGNIIPPEEVIEKYGVDILRLYLLSAASIGSDIKFNYEEIEQVEDALRILWNLCYMVTRYLEVDEFNLDEINREKVEKHFSPEDKWVISHTKRLASKIDQRLKNMEFLKAVRDLLKYFTDDLSRWYGKLVRRRLWIEKEDPRKKAVYLTFYQVFKLSLPLLGIFAPHLAEYLYQRTVRSIDDASAESVHLQTFPSSKGRDPKLEENMEIVRNITSAGLATRQAADIKLRWPLQKAVIETERKNVKEAVRGLEALLKDKLNVKSIEIREMGRRVKCHPSYKSLGPKFKEKADEISKKLRKADGNKVKTELDEKGIYNVKIDGKEYKITQEDVNLEPLPPKNYISEEIPGGHIFLLTERGEMLKAEGYARDIIRRIQEMRKEMALQMEDKITVEVFLSEPEKMKQALLEKEWKDYMKHETRAEELRFSSDSEVTGYTREWTIAGKTVNIGIKRLEE